MQFKILGNQPSIAFNPLADASVETITELFRQMCAHDGDSLDHRAEIDDQLEALVPALVELREAGHVKLNMAVAASYGTLDGFMRLADDERLTPLSRARCAAIRNRLLAQSLKAFFAAHRTEKHGHHRNLDASE